MSIIPDPLDPTKGAIDDKTGDLFAAVFMAPLGTPLNEMRRPENLIGYSDPATWGQEDQS